MIEICNVSKAIDDSDILKDVSFTVNKGSITALIGPNGAGKTSLIKTITGIWLPDKGNITVDKKPVYENPEVKAKIGYVPDSNHYYDSFKVKEIINMYKYLYKDFNLKRFEELNSIFQISISKRIRELSKGNKTRLSIMLNLCIMPQVLILDEPTSGLDPVAKKQFWDVLIDEVASRQTSVIISSHNLVDIEKVCDSIVLMDRGSITYKGDLDDLKRRVKKLQIVFIGEPPEALIKSKEVCSVSKIGSIYYITVKDSSKAFEEQVRSFGITLMEEIDITLEEIFVSIYGGEGTYAISEQSITI
ncbi:ABC transporter ATP-binding protein [Pseudobacteroides cellulosolvens]|uniref:ABC transporter related protein n=1 Tax=Pseudobacteroides cellulosolvens ATCC 35603 = DSM 2933 TaxID=398512 RepID=A0A0L6JV11_9FIRM|nr:ABC transporter ATP-binding protein [Pseudobacteroides cellulosolvens]KNY29247.1 ABC transporter related protein [Pseudobacteroides cellulosolvens ATCC 35603 = DSM 2933]